MNAEWFTKLKEYDSLGKQKTAQLKTIQEQRARLDSLDSKLRERLEESSKLSGDLRDLQQVFFEQEKKLKTSEEQAQRLRDIGGDDGKIKAFTDEAAKIENHLFELMDQTETLQQSINDAKTFVQGIEKTIQDISVEVNAAIDESERAIQQAEMRMNLIAEELPADFRSTLERALKRNLAVGVFTRLEDTSCFFCRYKMSRLEESEIDMQKQLKTCPQCSRIFLPYGI